MPANYEFQHKAHQIWLKVKLESQVDLDTCEHKSQKLYPFYTLREIVFLSFIM